MRDLGVIAAGKPIYCVGSPFTIKDVEHIVMYGVVIKIDGSTQKISLIIELLGIHFISREIPRAQTLKIESARD